MFNNRIKEEKIKRFSTGRIIEHWMAILTFGVLSMTGLAQKFYSLDISQWVVFHLGGIDSTRLIHRYAGILFSILLTNHILTAITGVIFKGWQLSMLINKKDFLDAIHNIQYYLGIKDHPARCDRYSYKQKFEYWGVLISGLLMIASGMTLWFPVFVTRFLPGEVIPAAKTLHTNQGFLAFLIIALWHIYNSVLSPDVFPLDTVIFTGKISKERMIKEHPLEYERLSGTYAEKQDEEGVLRPKAMT